MAYHKWIDFYLLEKENCFIIFPLPAHIFIYIYAYVFITEL